MPRIVAALGSGETAPTHTTTHRRLIDRSGGPPVLLDTPYGFQANADDISQRAVEYFERAVQRPITVASWRRGDDPALVRETALTRIRSAGYVFAGPGSPSYALRQWAGTPLPGLLADRLRPGGAGGTVSFASAAALTLGAFTVPVYEIYKVGEEPRWLEGLDLIGAVLGWQVAVVPHFDNAEGGNHDTRFCYLGETRLQRLEAQLPPDAWVLGVDEHTGLVLDLDAGTASVVGLGGVTVRSGGVVRLVVHTGDTVAVEALAAAAAGTAPQTAGVTSMQGDAAGFRHGDDGDDGDARADGDAVPASTGAGRSPLLTGAAALEERFHAALAARDVAGAVAAVLELDDLLEAWRADTLSSDEPDRVRSTLRSMVVRLGEMAVVGARDPRELLQPVVQVILDERSAARSDRDWGRSDELRDRLAAAGVEVRDTPGGQHWDITGS